MLSSCYVNDSLLNYVLYTLHTNPVPASPGRGDSILAGVSSAPGTLPAGHTIIHALLMFYKSCSLYLGCCAAHPSIMSPTGPCKPGGWTPVPILGRLMCQPALCLAWARHHIRHKVRAIPAFRIHPELAWPQLCPPDCRSPQLDTDNKVVNHRASPQLKSPSSLCWAKLQKAKDYQHLI